MNATTYVSMEYALRAIAADSMGGMSHQSRETGHSYGTAYHDAKIAIVEGDAGLTFDIQINGHGYAFDHNSRDGIAGHVDVYRRDL